MGEKRQLRVFRYRDPQDRSGAHHGQRGIATWVPRRGDRGHYWDGGLVSNTPLQWLVGSRPHLDTLTFQVDLWSARGEPPRTLAEVSNRQKEIQYSSRTRAGTDNIRHIQRLRRAMADLLDKFPEDLGNGPEAQVLRSVGDHKVYNIVHLIHRARNYEGHPKDYDISCASMQEHRRRQLRHHCAEVWDGARFIATIRPRGPFARAIS
jgi:predicted acylesterase/phospholipase RssA